MILIEFHVFNSGQPISINPDAIAQISSMPDAVGAHAHAIIHRQDGGSVEVKEDYKTVVARLTNHATIPDSKS
jgi:uncharacterized protein YlzI (FlbEa/FlbD family)